jgi:hypothetical protein
MSDALLLHGLCGNPLPVDGHLLVRSLSYAVVGLVFGLVSGAWNASRFGTSTLPCLFCIPSESIVGWLHGSQDMTVAALLSQPPSGSCGFDKDCGHWTGSARLGNCIMRIAVANCKDCHFKFKGVKMSIPFFIKWSHYFSQFLNP